MCVYILFIFIFIYCVLRPLWCQLKGQQPRTAVNDMRPLYLPDIRLVCEDFRGRLTPVRELGLRGKPCTPNSWATVVQGCSQGYASFGRSLEQLILDVSTFSCSSNAGASTRPGSGTGPLELRGRQIKNCPSCTPIHCSLSSFAS